MTEDISPGELARRMNDVLRQFQSLVDQVETRYIRKDYLDLYKQSIDQMVAGLKVAMDAKADAQVAAQILANLAAKVDKAEVDSLKQDVAELKDANKWMMRLVLSFVVVAILGAVFTVGGGIGR